MGKGSYQHAWTGNEIVGMDRSALIQSSCPFVVNWYSKRHWRERNDAMHAGLSRIGSSIALILFLCAAAASPAHARQFPSDKVLKDNGLKRPSGATWILVSEAVVLKDVKKASNLATQLKGAQQQQRELEMGDQNPQVLIDNYRQQIDWLGQSISAYDEELARLGPPAGIRAADIQYNLLVNERNAIIGEQRRLSNLINNLSDQRGQFREMKQQFNSEVARVRESYMQAVTDSREAVGKINAKYAELNGNAEASQALKDLSKSIKIQQKLGPSKDLANATKWLARLEGSVQSETVALQRENGVDHVDVMLNGKGPIRMVFDTGAGPTTLSAAVASQLNLKATGRTVSLVVADGTKVMAKEMIIRSVTVGRLTVRDVTCVVMPKDKGDVNPLLGQSFLQRFDFKYTQGAGRLVLTKVEPDESAAIPGKGNGSRKKR
jgi:clan AA aspartic protease (TIGR02281 family)